ncbi:ATP-binding protein [Parabacteroides sp. PF5-6]|uniref:hybrid sensor histidine kinase/response regulator n=1 Tax=Parabacteroides sp. PF5-6 TaxID=1742403 RepID=UPI002406D262|nr:ATP-binding protein [Parabacteroides sp. PF5-6]MDF9830623.1 signal transduction histidine kinase/CheY-like chemotaxis protein [Parabacteroides sp. PF5-6]
MDSTQGPSVPGTDFTHSEEMRQLTQRCNAIIESLPGFIFVFDDQFFLREVYMPESMKLFHSMKELVGMDARIIYSPEVSELIIHTIHQCLADGQLRELEYHVDLKGLRFYYQARLVPYKDNLVLALIQDIGDRIRRMDELVDIRKRQEANLMKSSFLANMSHEIRTPLNAIVGFSEILASDEFFGEKEEIIAIIRKNNELLLQLINDILDISRIESGRIEINLQHTELNELLKEIFEVQKIKMKPEVELHLLLPPEEIYTYTDPNRIRQVVHNFLSNAAKHTFEGSITLQMKIEKDNTYTISVTDTGTGITEDKLPYVFERFEKLDNFTQGTGLGLAISKSLVEHLGGEIGATSVFGQGSTFFFRIPLRQTMKEAEEAQPLPPDEQVQPQESLHRKKILAIGFDELDFGPIHTVLSNEYIILKINDKEEGLEKYLSLSPELLMVHVSSPVIDGLNFVKRIRDLSFTTPIIAFTEYGNYTAQEKALKAGCNDIVLKPYTASRLKDAVISYI